MNPVNKIINDVFRKIDFLDTGYSSRTKEKLIQSIGDFNRQYPNTVSDLLSELKANVLEAKIENWTQFFNLDRCVRFLIQFDDEKRYVFQLSIFGYFSVYHCPYELVNDKYIYGPKLFINPNELVVCDELFKCTKSIIANCKWLNRDILNQPVYDFSVPEINYQYEVKVADLLFTEHYL